MALRTYLISCLLLLLTSLVSACADDVEAPVLTLAATAAVNQPGEGDEREQLATNTPAIPATAGTDTPAPAPPLPTATPAAVTHTPGIPATAAPTEASDDLEAIDTALQEIDNDLCREAHEARAEIAELLAQGEEVGDLEAAIIELIEELENCSLEITPAP